jgi:intein/homing endonuclease
MEVVILPVKKSHYGIEDLLGSESSFTSMSSTEKEYFIQLLQEEMKRREDVSKPEQIRDIVPIQDWITSEYYVGKDCKSIYPYWQDFIVDVFREDRKPEERINQVILGGCFTGDTKISMLDGRELSFLELIDEYGEGTLNPFWVYSCDKFGNIVPGKAYASRKTKVKAKIVKVTLDNGEEIKCTPNHPFMLRDGSYKRADELAIGESLMPLYREYIKQGKGDRSCPDGYERVYNPSDGMYRLTHSIVSKKLHQDAINKIHDDRGDCVVVTHHYDFNKRNNTPQNLVPMEMYDHYRLHSILLREAMQDPIKGAIIRAKLSDATKRRWENDSDYRNMMSKTMKEIANSEEYLTGHWSDVREKALIYSRSERGRLQSAKNLENWNNRIGVSEEDIRLWKESVGIGSKAWWDSDEGAKEKEIRSARLSDWNNSGNASRISSDFWDSDEGTKEKEKRAEIYRGRNKSRANKILSEKRSFYESIGVSLDVLKDVVLKYSRWSDVSKYLNEVYGTHLECTSHMNTLLHCFGIYDRKEFTDNIKATGYVYKNHKVVGVEVLDELEDVYDITVDEYHNFALSCGVFVHNSIGIGKSCLNKETRIPTSIGLLSLEDLYDRFHNKGERFQVLSESGIRDCTDVFDNGEADTRILHFKSGRYVECTLNHKFRVIKDGKKEWVESKDLSIGNKIILTRKNSPFGQYKVNPDEAYAWGVDGKSYEVPYQILRADKNGVASYLKGVLSRKASRSFNNSGKLLSVMSVEKEFIYDVASLFSMFGVNYRVVEYVLEDSSLYEMIIDDKTSLVICDLAILKREPRYDVKTVNVWFDDEIVDIQEGHCHTMDLTIDEDHSYCFNGIVSHNTCAEILMLRKLYELSCWKNVNALFKLMSKTSIMFLYFSVNKTQAERTGFGEIRNWIDRSPYFKDNFPRKGRLKDILLFPEGLTFAYGSGSSDSIGMSVIGTIMDEANFVGGYRDSGNAERASEMYAGIVNRANSRFIIDGGINHSLNILVSSATHESSVTERQIAASRNDPHTIVCAPSQWEVKPDKFSKKFFYVCKGTDYLEPHIVRSTDDVNNFRLSEGLKKENYVDGIEEYDQISKEIEKLPNHLQDKFIRVPEDLRQGFETNIMRSLQDMGGVSVASSGKLFSSVAVYNACVDSRFHHPFISESIVVSTGDNIQIKDFLRSDFRLKHPERPRFLHIDQSITGDDTGISCVYVDEVVEEDGVKKPIFGVDFMLQINPPKPPKKIAIYKIRNFVIYLANTIGMKIGMVSYDIFNSEESRQILEEMGFNVKYQSVDRTDKAYLDTVEIMYEGRLRMYDYKIFRNEIFNVVHDRARHKVDHVKINSDGTVGKKDTADSLCLSYDTQLFLLSGEELTIEELYNNKDILDDWILACDVENQKIVPVKIEEVIRKSFIPEKLYKISLDNGKSFSVTGDHLVLMRDGSYKKAEELQINDSLMLFISREYSTSISIDISGIEIVPNNHYVYDLRLNTIHNFGIDAGVFVHNCGAIENALQFKISEGAQEGRTLNDFLYANDQNTLFEPDAMSVEDMIDKQIDDIIEDMEYGANGGFGWF